MISFKIREHGDKIPNGISFFKYKVDLTKFKYQLPEDPNGIGLIIKFPYFYVWWKRKLYNIDEDKFDYHKSVLYFLFKVKIRNRYNRKNVIRFKNTHLIFSVFWIFTYDLIKN